MRAVCRHLAYLGPPLALSALVLEPPHSLEHQSFAPRLQRHSPINADGFGVGWWAPQRPDEPARYRTTTPIWADRSFASIAPVIEAGAVVAAVRSATPPLPVEESGNAPFVAGRWLGSLNGFVAGFRGSPAARLRAELGPDNSSRLEGNNDGETLVALFAVLLERGMAAPAALARTVALADEAGPGPKNILLSDGQTILATTVENSLYTRAAGRASVIVSSEPLDDDPAWTPVPDRCLVRARPGCLQIQPLSNWSSS